MTPPLERATYHHGDLRNALVEKAVRLIAERGPEAFSLREAARALGVSPAAAYRHFADKTALLAAVAQDGFSRLATAMERAMAKVGAPAGSKEHAVGTLSAVGEAYVDFAVRHTPHFRVMFGPWMSAVEDCVPGVGPSGKDAYQLLVEALDGLVAAKVIDADDRAGAEVVAWSTVHGFAALVVDGTLQLTPREREGTLRFVLRKLHLGIGVPAHLLPVVEPMDLDRHKPRCQT